MRKDHGSCAEGRKVISRYSWLSDAALTGCLVMHIDPPENKGLSKDHVEES